MSDYQPDELLTEILTRLPVPSLLRFKSVCKPWYSLITSPGFAAKHLNQSVANAERNGGKLLVRVYGNYGRLPEPRPFPRYELRYLLLNDDDNFGDEYSEMKLPVGLRHGFYRIVGTCNGLICIDDDYLSARPRIIIWNPSTRKTAVLPRASMPQCSRMFYFGFGVHPITHEYKVARIKFEVGAMPIGSPYKLPLKAEIYSQGTRSWRGISSHVPPYWIVNYIGSQFQVFVDGAVHFLAYDLYQEGDFRNLILVFNMASESFSEFKLPPTLRNQPLVSLSIVKFGQSLALVSSRREDSGGFCIWGMKDYGVAESWTKLFSSNLLGSPNKTLGFRKNGDVLLAAGNSPLVSYAPESQTWATTRISGFSVAFSVDPFMETLFLV